MILKPLLRVVLEEIKHSKIIDENRYKQNNTQTGGMEKNINNYNKKRNKNTKELKKKN